MRWDFFQFKDIAKEGGSESRARRPLELPHRARFRKYGAYVIQGLCEMAGGLCIMVKNDVLFRVVGL